MYNYKEEDNLSPTETLVMKIIWDYGSDIPLSALIEQINQKYKKDYKRTTVTTFVSNLADKKYVESYKIGKYSYIHALKKEDEYREKLMDFWYQGDVSMFVAALGKRKRLSKGDVSRLREVLDELED